MTSKTEALTAKQQHFVDEMIRMRGIEFARLGMQVEVNGHIGTITKTIGANLGVTYANQMRRGPKPVNCHPTWNIKYFDEEGKVIAEFNEDGNCIFRPERVAA